MPEKYTQEEIEELNKYLDTTSKKYDDLCSQISSDIIERQNSKKESLLDIHDIQLKLIEADDKMQEKLQNRMLSMLETVHEFDMKVKRDNREFEKADIIPTSVLDYF